MGFKSDPDEFIHDYAIVNTLHPERRIEGLRFVYVELPKFQPKTIAERKMAVLWLRFLTEISEHTKDAPAELLENELTEKALAIVEKSAMDEVQLYNYEKFWQAVINEEALIEGGYDEGLAKGMAKGEAKGRAEERKEMARKMKALGLSAELIMQTTGLSAEDMAEL